MILRLTIEHDEKLAGALFYVTSPDERGLFIAMPSLDEALEYVPDALDDLRMAREAGKVAQTIIVGGDT